MGVKHERTPHNVSQLKEERTNNIAQGTRSGRQGIHNCRLNIKTVYIWACLTKYKPDVSTAVTNTWSCKLMYGRERTSSLTYQNHISRRGHHLRAIGVGCNFINTISEIDWSRLTIKTNQGLGLLVKLQNLRVVKLTTERRVVGRKFDLSKPFEFC